jgi:hypothetical protein
MQIRRILYRTLECGANRCLTNRLIENRSEKIEKITQKNKRTSRECHTFGKLPPFCDPGANRTRNPQLRRLLVPLNPHRLATFAHFANHGYPIQCGRFADSYQQMLLRGIPSCQQCADSEKPRWLSRSYHDPIRKLSPPHLNEPL